MPAGTAAPDRSVPGRFFGFVWGLPKSEITRVFLFVFVGVDALARAIDVAGQIDLGKFAVLGKRFNPVIDRTIRLVGVVTLFQFFDQRNHLRNVLGGSWS